MKSQNTLEEWRPIDGYENLYAVSSKGRVMNLKKNKMIKPWVSNYGYVLVNLRKNGKQKKYLIHKLVAEAFIPNPYNLPQINHIDECKSNNNVTNLEWCTPSQNQRHSIYQRSCKINQYTLDGEFIKQWESSHEIERNLGYNDGNIISCCKNKQKTAYGYRWKYTDGLHQQKQNRPVAVLTKDGEYVAKYKSAAEAARFLKISTTQIYFCLNGTYKSTHGLRFIYID